MNTKSEQGSQGNSEGNSGGSNTREESSYSRTSGFFRVEYSPYHETISSELSNAVERYFEDWRLVLIRGNGFAQHHWTSHIEQSRISLVLLSGSLNDASVNLSLSSRMTTKAFKAVEKDSLASKWSLRLKKRVRGYELPSELEEDLNAFVDRLNAVTHPQPTFSMAEDPRPKGTLPGIQCDEHELMWKWVSLTPRLLQNLDDHDSKIRPLTYSLSRSCFRPVLTWDHCQERLNKVLAEAKRKC